MRPADLRWHQHFENLQRALRQLEKAINAHGQDRGNELTGMTLIKAYEFGFKLSWQTHNVCSITTASISVCRIR